LPRQLSAHPGPPPNRQKNLYESRAAIRIKFESVSNLNPNVIIGVRGAAPHCLDPPGQFQSPEARSDSPAAETGAFRAGAFFSTAFRVDVVRDRPV
jgi:hypothetical protein